MKRLAAMEVRRRVVVRRRGKEELIEACWNREDRRDIRGLVL